MYTSTLITGALSLLAIGATAAPTTSSLSPRQANPDNTIGLFLNSSQFDINALQTFRLSYANSSAYIGAIKYQSYSEPLVIGSLSGPDNSVSFLSIHSAPTGFQQMYIVPHQTQPVGFSVPHGGAPAGVSTGGFSFGPRGTLLHNGRNNFYACQNAELAELESWQIWWWGAGQPGGMSCKGPIKIVSGDACSRY
ncbi:hypothetical protein H2200_009362 [Cladophialophora chaetospira]|uniref:Uncharacterized protein n=1 Tax=Cladophialophora chaetospira TaxID=386627 RepID=A0AA39CFH5_9EURO|nr:hypothetical protein H2200_009362 [Cladophialophora chaetospira]